MSEHKQKFEIFYTIWDDFEKIKDILLKSGIADNRLQERINIEKKIHLWHFDKMRDGRTWMNAFLEECIKPWQKLRRENTEEYWENAKKLGWGEEYQEIRELKKLSKVIRETWFNRRNILVKEKKKRNDKGTTNPAA
jgi:hypothetical protein